jgi:Transglutaminase-like superfamily
MSVPSPEPQRVSVGVVGVARRSHDGRLTRSQRVRLAVEILAAYARARHELRRAPIADVVASLRSVRSCSRVNAGAGALEEARRLGQAVTRLLTFVPGDTRCLARSLVLTKLLARRGIPAKLVIGARAAPDFLAHAWVEYAGDPVLTPGDGSFRRLVEL